MVSAVIAGHDDVRCTYCGSPAITYIYPDGLPTPVCGACVNR